MNRPPLLRPPRRRERTPTTTAQSNHIIIARAAILALALHLATRIALQLASLCAALPMFYATFIAASAAAAALLAYAHRPHSTVAESSTHKKKTGHGGFATPALEAKYSAFRRNYLAVYLLVNASDWLCGPYLYSVYKEHGMDLATISTLSVVGFLSSAVLGSYLGSLSDRWGRRKLCLLYPVAFALNSLLIQVPNFYLLLLGRVFGGIATSLLFSVFEAWMTSEYFASGFPGGDALGSLFSTAVTLNSVVAIAAGLIANYAVDVTATTRAPFLIALIPAFAGSAIVALTWSENYGESSASTTSSSGPPNGGLIAAIRQEPAIALVGAVQACFEGAMYGFVCLFGPSLDELAAPLNLPLPFGLIFATFMVFCMVGSTLSGLSPISRASLVAPTMAVASASLLAASQSSSLPATFLAFCAFEATVGVYFPTIFALRSAVVPESVRGTALSAFRVPLNAIVVALLTQVGKAPVDSILVACSGILAVAAVAGGVLARRQSTVAAVKPKSE